MPKGFVGKPMRWLLLVIAAMGLPAVLIGWKHWSFGRDFDAVSKRGRVELLKPEGVVVRVDAWTNRGYASPSKSVWRSRPASRGRA